jgi:Fic family protein
VCRSPPVILLAAFNLDFLCIHPLRDGSGRVSRLLWLLQSYRLGYEVGRYISLERLAEQNKDRYYETLEQSSRGWHEGKHDPSPFVNYVLSIFKSAYRAHAAQAGHACAIWCDNLSVTMRPLRWRICFGLHRCQLH